MRLIIRNMAGVLIALLSISSVAYAQVPTDRLILKKGQKIKMTNEMKSDMEQAQRGKMNTQMTSVSELEVMDITDVGYKLGATMQEAKMKFKGFGMEQEYDSEDEKKQEGMIAGTFNKILNKQEVVQIDFQGKIIPKEGAEKKKGGMMRMIGGGDATSAVEGAFLVVPKGKKAGDKWRTTLEKDGLKIITEYTFQGMMGNMVNLTANQQTKGEIVTPRGTSNVNQLTQMTLMVDGETGLVSMKTIETKDKSSIEMGGETYNSSGTINITITCE